MNRYARALVATFSAVLLASINSLVRQKSATGSTPLSVTVTNPLQPATRSGAGNVSFNGTAQPVSFRNTAATPLSTHDVFRHNGFAQFLGCTVPTSGDTCSVKLEVPPGVELVIETVSVGGALNSGEHTVVTMEFTTRGISSNVLTLPLTFAGTFGNESPPDEYAVTQPLRVYADPNTTVELDANISDNTGGAGFHFEVSGYLVRCDSESGCRVP